jgi:acetyltransferase-like isoleucine patch superfamily enzyme
MRNPIEPIPGRDPGTGSAPGKLIDIPNGRVGQRLTRLPTAIRKRLLRPWYRWRFAEFGEGSELAWHSEIVNPGSIAIGRRVQVQRYARIEAHDLRDDRVRIRIGDGSIIAPYVHIEDGVYIGERVAILRGVRIGTCSIVGTNSVVTCDVPPYSIVVGIPARVIKIWDPATRLWSRVDG